MNIVPGLHSALVSVPKLADAGYTMVLTKDGMAIYDDNTTAITASNSPILESDWCKDTGLWRLNLDPENPNTYSPNKQHVTPKMINVIFDLPSSCKTFLCYHALTGFPPKETFIDAVRSGNYETWPKLTMTLISRYYPNLDKTVNGHLKGQRQGIQSTKQKALEKIIENKMVRIKTEGKKSKNHLSTTSQSPKPTKLSSVLRTSPTQVTLTKRGSSHSLPNEATDTSWWQSTLTETTSLSSLCMAGQRKR
jgi:hypothetical protein